MGEDVELRLAVPGDSLRVMRPFGVEIPIQRFESEVVVKVSDRSYLVFADADGQQVQKVLSNRGQRLP